MKEDAQNPERPANPARRSVHFVPYTLLENLNLERLAELQADMVVVDLEDSVRPEDKDRSRVDLTEKLPLISGSIKGELCIRINPLWTEEGMRDLTALHDHILMIPKIYSIEELEKLEGVKEFVPIFETLQSLALAETILRRYRNQIRTILYGKEDLLAEIGKMNPDPNSTNPVPSADLRKNRDLFDGFLQLVRDAGQVGDFEILDGISRDIDEGAGQDFKDEVTNAVQLGATGKISIYPTQVEGINQVFAKAGKTDVGSASFETPPRLPDETDDERKLAKAVKIVEAFRSNTNSQNAAAVDIDGETIIIGPPTYKLCLKLLEKAPPN